MVGSSVEDIDQILIFSEDGWLVLNDVLLYFQKVAIVVGAVPGKVNQLVTEMPVKLDREPFVVGSVVVYEELRCHFGVEKSAENGVGFAFD